MMKTYLSIFLLIVFSALSILHFYWANGGSWGFAEALPTDANGKRLLNPSALESAIVGTGLMLFGIYYLLQSGLVLSLPTWTFFKIIGWIIPGIFLLRAIGDFKFIGIFKPPLETAFAKADLYFYSPLCLLIALLGFLIIRPND
ncbi:Protein of unknown function [Reichenbachiella faecimaris]|uniref:DUF3995 domain-containing protein n=1 Tax=Reichenbachiella faecimaris TaxID=692418 RepID=A0A1W2G8I4_REIFA|nr:DUF3995 domain-containing protein [Reichenbachiella faecimaris]SMD32638.1 Protein of unknown function [Reichenbachiella faecimaris]